MGGGGRGGFTKWVMSYHSGILRVLGGGGLINGS